MAAYNRKPSTPKDRRSFVYSASLPRTWGVSVAKLVCKETSAWSPIVGPGLRHALCKSAELARPHLSLVAKVDYGVIRLETAMVKIFVRVDAGEVVTGEV